MSHLVRTRHGPHVHFVGGCPEGCSSECQFGYFCPCDSFVDRRESHLCVELAREFATEAHADQKYGEYPYWAHLADVAQVARHFELPLVVEVAAWLHDSLEDTDTTPDEILHTFGAEVLALVQSVTDEPGKNRKERKAKTYPKMYGNDLATKLKLCDRIANVERVIDDGRRDLFTMYCAEQEDLERALYIYGVGGPQDVMWAHLKLIMRAGAVKMSTTFDYVERITTLRNP